MCVAAGEAIATSLSTAEVIVSIVVLAETSPAPAAAGNSMMEVVSTGLVGSHKCAASDIVLSQNYVASAQVRRYAEHFKGTSLYDRRR